MVANKVGRLELRRDVARDIGPDRRRAAVVLSLGGMLAGVAASSCCVIPFALFLAGVSGAWIGNLTALAPYQPVFVAIALAFLASGFVMVYRKPKIICATGSSCAGHIAGRVAKIGLWTASGLVVNALNFPYAIRLLVEA